MNAPYQGLISFYAGLLNLYPAAFREEFGEEIVSDFSERITEVHAQRPGALPGICLRESVWLLFNSLREHWHAYRQKKGLKNSSPPRGNGLVAGAALVYALAGVVSAIFGLFTGIPFLPKDQYTPAIFLVSFLWGLSMDLTAGTAFWRIAVKEPVSPLRLLPGLAVVRAFYMLLTLFWVVVIPSPPILDSGLWFFVVYGWPVIILTLQGAVITGWLGYAGRGRKAITSFAVSGIIGKVLGFAACQTGMITIYHSLRLTQEWSAYTGEIWFILMDLALAMMSGILFGAFLGWAALRSGPRAAKTGQIAQSS